MDPAPEQRLGQGDEQESLLGREGAEPAGGRSAGGVVPWDGGVGCVIGDHGELVGRGPGREPHRDTGEGDGELSSRREPGLSQAILVGEGGGQAGAHVGQPPQAFGAAHLQEAPVQEGVVVDDQIRFAADGEGSIGIQGIDLAQILDPGDHLGYSPQTWGEIGDDAVPVARPTWTWMHTCWPAASATVAEGVVVRVQSPPTTRHWK